MKDRATMACISCIVLPAERRGSHQSMKTLESDVYDDEG